MTDFLQTERRDSILIVRMNRPETHNALTDVDQIREITDLCQSIKLDTSIKAMVLTGNGKSFCSGGNVKDMHTREGIFKGNPYELRNSYRTGIQTIPLALYEVEVPVIAAVNGAAIGAGLDLACMCDVRISSEKAIYAESFVKLGIIPGDGGAWLLQRIIGQAKATLMSLTGETINAATALDYGLVAKVVLHDTLEEEALAIAEKMVANPGHALRLTKRLLREAQYMKLDSLLELSAAYQALAHNTNDHHEAVSAFIEKRTPKYTDD